MKTFDMILQDNEATEENARDFANGFAWGECAETEQAQPTHSRFVDTVNGIEIYYDYAADYYFFAAA